MRLPHAIRERFRRHGRDGGRKRAARLTPATRRAIARRAASARWIRAHFGASSFEDVGLPGGDVVDKGLLDLAAERVTVESLLLSLAAPRLRREGVPLSTVHTNPENRIYDLLSRTEGDLAHARYRAYLRQLASFADACRMARLDRRGRAS